MDKKLYIITGANGNIGSELSRYFLDNGSQLLLLYFKNDFRIKELIEQYPQKITALSANLTDFKNLKSEIDLFLKKYDMKEIYLIHTSATRSFDSKPLRESDSEIWDNIFFSNIKSAFNILKVFLPIMKKNKFGRIVLFGSNVTRKGLKNGSAYAAAKSAIASITRSVALEEGENNVIINAVSPGPVKIDDSHFSLKYRKFRENYYQEEKKSIPLKRLAKPDDLVGICDFLLSENNRYISGEEIFVTGGNL